MGDDGIAAWPAWINALYIEASAGIHPTCSVGAIMRMHCARAMMLTVCPGCPLCCERVHVKRAFCPPELH